MRNPNPSADHHPNTLERGLENIRNGSLTVLLGSMALYTELASSPEASTVLEPLMVIGAIGAVASEVSLRVVDNHSS